MRRPSPSSRSWKLLAVGLLAVVALPACTTVDQDAIAAEKFSQETLDDPKIPIGPGSTIQVESFEWGFRVDGIAVDGPVTVDLTNVGGAEHNFTIDNAAGEVKGVQAGAGDAATGELLLFGGGEYTYYCSIPGHRSQGMEGTLTVYLPGEEPEETDAPSEEPSDASTEATDESTGSDGS